MNKNLIKMLKTSAEADKAKALLSLDLLGNNGVGIGDHSTKDFYNNAEEALQMLVDADDKLETIKKYFENDEKVS
jgi:flagellar motor component MotA